MDSQATAGTSPFGASTLPSGIPLRREDVARADEADSDRVYRNVEVMNYSSGAFAPLSSRDSPMVGGPLLTRSYEDVSLKNSLAAPSKPNQILFMVTPANVPPAPTPKSLVTSAAPRSLLVSLSTEASTRGVDAFLAAEPQRDRMHAKCKAEGDSTRIWVGYVLCESSQLTQFRLRLTSVGVSSSAPRGSCLVEVLRERGSDTECLDGILVGLHDHFGAQTASYINGGGAVRRRCCPPPVCSEEEEGEDEGCISAGIAALSDMLLRGSSQEALQCIGQLSYNRNKTVLESENLLADLSRFLQARVVSATPAANDACMLLALTCSCLRNMLSGVASTGALNGMLADSERVATLRGSLQSLEGHDGEAFIDSCVRSEARKALEILSAVALSC